MDKQLVDYANDGWGEPTPNAVQCEDDQQLETFSSLGCDERYVPDRKHTPRPWYDPTEVMF